jgi:uncharacterized protein (DUF1697 family)
LAQGPSSNKDQVFVGLLRGINVGGKHSLPMKTLVKLFEAAGATAVRTYIQSGNVVYRAPRGRGNDVCEVVSRSVREQLEIPVPIVVRSGPELARVAAGHPLAVGADPKTLHVVFLSLKSTASQVASLDPDRSPPDRFIFAGSEIYLCCPNGMARTKLTNAYFDRALGAVSTVRNWSTVQKLLAMAQE